MAKKKLTLEDVIVPKDEIPYEVPENWCWTRLQYIGKWSSGGTPKSTIEEYYNGDIPWLVIADLNDGYVSESNKSITSLGIENSSAKIIEKNSVLVAMYGSIGKLGINTMACACNQAIAYMKEEYNLVNNKYLFYYLLSQRDYLNSLGRGGTQQNISLTVLNKVEIPIPPLAEQERIVKRIESLFEKVEKAYELVEEARDGFEKRRAAILEKAFSGELTKKWREENGISDEWRVEKLSNYVKLISGQHIMNKDYNDEGIGIPYLTGPSDFNEINPIVSKWTEKPKALATNNDILITVKGSGVGKVNICDIEEVAISRQLMAIRCVEVENMYVFWYIKNKFNLLQQLSTGTAIPGLSRGNILELDINICSKEEQKEVVRILEDMLTKESNVEEHLRIFDKIDTIKKSILAKAFRGELGSNNLEEKSSINLLKYL